MKQILKSAYQFPHWRARRARYCSLTPEDKPPSAIRFEHLAAMVDEAKSPWRRRPKQVGLSKAEYFYAYRSTLRGWARTVAGWVQRRDRLKDRQSDVDADHLLDLVLQQGGLCAYSGVPMELLKQNSHWRVSIERRDTRQGYVRGNCCLIAAEFNSAVHTGTPCNDKFNSAGSAQWSEEKVKEVLHLRAQPVPLEQLQEDIAIARLRPTRTGRSWFTGFRGPDAKDNWRCGSCGFWKPAERFSKRASVSTGLYSWCKKCQAYLSSVHFRPMRGHALSLLRSARQRAATGRYFGSFMLELDEVLDMLWLQGGRCFYSGVPLHCAPGPADWVWSIERLDNSVTYTKGNCVLIAREFQSSLPSSVPNLADLQSGVPENG
ncbi:unnamed protein product, partial [Symbiodinium sp. CCMP2456]